MHDIVLVTPCRNAAATIDATIWSVVSQSGPISIRYHVQDGQSTDGTQDKLAAWEEKIALHRALLPGQVQFSWSSEPDSGMYDAIAKAFRSLPSEPEQFMGWLNADDTLWPGALEAVCGMGAQLPAVDWVMGYPVLLNQHGRITNIKFACVLPQEVIAAGLTDGVHWHFVQQESTFWRRRLYDRVGGLDTSFRLAGDWDLWRRFARCAPLVHMQRQLGSFSMCPGQLTTDLSHYRREMERQLPAQRRALRQQALSADKSGTYEVLITDKGADGTWQIGKASISERTVERPTPVPVWEHLLVLPGSPAKRPPLFTPGFDPNAFTYGRISHMRQLVGSYITGPAGVFDGETCDLKAFQDALCTAFIDQVIPQGGRVLEVGGGTSRVLPVFQDSRECWNIDKFEGVGNGVTAVPHVGYRLVLDYMGQFNPELPAAAFDCVFSISALEHVPENETTYAAVLADITRVLKPGGWSLHLLDIVRNPDGTWWMNGLVDYLFDHVATANAWRDPEADYAGADLFFLREPVYNQLWLPVTKKSYAEFGQPGSIAVMWQKPVE